MAVTLQRGANGRLYVDGVPVVFHASHWPPGAGFLGLWSDVKLSRELGDDCLMARWARLLDALRRGETMRPGVF